MTVALLLSASRIRIASAAEGSVRNKAEALEQLATLLSEAPRPSSFPQRDEILHVIAERERLQSTGFGAGVAVPHGALAALDAQRGALLVCREPIEFEAMDGKPVSLIFGLIGPKGAAAQHLKTLARIARLMRDAKVCAALRAADAPDQAYAVLLSAEQGTEQE